MDQELETIDLSKAYWHVLFFVIGGMTLVKFLSDRFLRLKRIALIVGTFGLIFAMASPAFAQNGCRTGADALANAYVRSNPMNALYIGDLESYIAANRSHFIANGDAIQCARAMSVALLQGAIRAYDPNAFRRQQELNAQLGAMGISPGPAQASPSAMLYAMGQKMSWFVRVLPPAARGDYGPLRTPVTQQQQMEAFAGQMLQMLLQDPSMRRVLIQIEPLARELIEMEYRQLMAIAAGLAQ